MSSNFIYYVYAYIRKDGTPYYIGKGKGRRAYAKHLTVALPPKSRIIILEKNLSEVGALAIERRLIAWWGRKNVGTGILYNRTEGGDGVHGNIVRKGYTLTDEHRQKIAESKRGKKRAPFSEEWINNLRSRPRTPASSETNQKKSDSMVARNNASYTITTPEGNRITVNNLRGWCRETFPDTWESARSNLASKPYRGYTAVRLTSS